MASMKEMVKKMICSGTTWKGTWIAQQTGIDYKLCVLRDLNGWIRDRVKPGVTGAFGVPGKNDNG